MNLAPSFSIAENLLQKLEPHCIVCDIAGSIRRGLPIVGDIEICCVPKMTQVARGLFAEDLAEEVNSDFQMTVLNFGKVIKGLPTGRMMQIQIGRANDAEDYMANCIMLDLFIPQKKDYYRQFAIRTGSADYSHQVIANGWFKQGWVGTAEGLRRREECRNIGTEQNKKWRVEVKTPTLPPQWKSEQEFFEFIKVPWIEPKLREVKL